MVFNLSKKVQKYKMTIISEKKTLETATAIGSPTYSDFSCRKPQLNRSVYKIQPIKRCDKNKHEI